MMSCKATALALSSDSSLTPWRRMSLTMHLAMCRHCRAFAKQLRRFGTLGRLALERDDAALPADFESRIVSHILR